MIARVVVALHLEDAGQPVADIDDARVLARALDDARARWSAGPCRCLRDDLYEQCSFHIAETMPSSGQRRVAPDQAAEPRVLVGRQAVLGHELGGDGNVVAEHAAVSAGSGPSRETRAAASPNRAGIQAPPALERKRPRWQHPGADPGRTGVDRRGRARLSGARLKPPAVSARQRRRGRDRAPGIGPRGHAPAPARSRDRDSRTRCRSGSP